MECKEPDPCQLHDREPSGDVLHRQPCDEELQTHEYSTVDADIHGKIDSVLNPSGGTIRAEHIGDLIIEKDKIDPSKTKIICSDVEHEKQCACA